MLFNSYVFILLFLPIFVIGYFALNKFNNKMAIIFIIMASAIFYLYGGINISIILGVSIVFNYVMALVIQLNIKKKRIFLGIVIIVNILLLLYFKYFNFLVEILNEKFTLNYSIKELWLPLGISFFTFQQIMYVVSVYRKELEKVDLAEYLAYILFFPKLIMGPLVEPKTFIVQLNDKEKKCVCWDNVIAGLRLFSYGLFKKMIFADTFSKAVAWGFNNINDTTSGDLFLVMLFYTFEIYFDFSGYTDMAVGISKMINISFPMNFNSPYKAFSIRDFWKRWHMSLTMFLTKYIYYPLGGNRKGIARTYINILIVFLLSGFWHGANWTFILWGMIYGLLQIVERILEKVYDKIFDVVKWGYTFLTINLLWLLFRAESVSQWKLLIVKMFSFQNMSISEGLINSFVVPESEFLFNILNLTGVNESVRGFGMLSFIVFAFIICFIPDNNYKTMHRLNLGEAFFSAFAFVWAFLCLSNESVFVYFNF